MSGADFISGPHAHGARSVSRTMLLVMAALLPSTVFGIYIYGWPSFNLFMATVVSAVLIEAACLKFNLSPKEAEFLGRSLKENK